MTANRKKHFLFALVVGLLTVGCSSSDAARNSAAPPGGAVESETATLGAISDPVQALWLPARIVAAAISAEVGPHGGIGEPATASAP